MSRETAPLSNNLEVAPKDPQHRRELEDVLACLANPADPKHGAHLSGGHYCVMPRLSQPTREVLILRGHYLGMASGQTTTVHEASDNLRYTITWTSP